MPLRSRAGRRLKWLFVSVCLYLSTYLVLSRRGFAEADRTHAPGFYYFAPQDTDGWRFLNRACVLVFRPVQVLDRWLGSGREPAAEPLFGLSGAGPGTTAGRVREASRPPSFSSRT